MNILIIEDDDGIRQTLQWMLEFNGHTVSMARDGTEGVKLAEKRPDMIFCDVGLPGRDGYAVIQEIQKIPDCRAVPFVFLTARADRDDQRRGMALGADDYITKPFSEKDILDAIAARMERHGTLCARVEEVVNRERAHEVEADWSHELLTPLAGVMGGLELIEKDADSITPAELRELLSIIRAGAERQERLSRKLIQYFELQRLKGDPRNLLGQCVAGDQAAVAGALRAAQDAGREKDLHVDCEAAVVSGAEPYLADAIVQVVENAFRFSKPGDPVSVTGVVRGSRYRIEVLDRGIGMTEDERRAVGAFVQFNRRKLEQQGLGLGVAIARSIVELFQGSLGIEAGADGTGIMVSIELNCA